MAPREPGKLQPGERVTDPVTGVTPPVKLRTPLQLWLPRLGGDLGRPEVARDALRAYATWDGDVRVWLSPGFKRVTRWVREGFSEVALPTEHVERLDVYHIGENGRAFGHGSRKYFPEGRLDGLLEAWLNIADLGGGRSVLAPESQSLEFPDVGEQGVRYDHVRIPIEGGAAFPTERTPDDRVAVYWPREGRAVPPTMFPDAESLAENPALGRSIDDAGNPTVTYRDGTIANQVINVWPEPVDGLMSALGSFGDLVAQQRMATIAKTSAHDLAAALRLAREGASPFLTSTRVPSAYASIYPLLLNSGPEAILRRAENVGVSADDLHEAYSALRARTLTRARLAVILGRSVEFRQAMAEPVLIQRAWGAIGLFWVLLLEELEGRRAFSSCGRCGRITRGKRGKQFCGLRDNAFCYRARRAIDQRRSRGQRG